MRLRRTKRLRKRLESARVEFFFGLAKAWLISHGDVPDECKVCAVVIALAKQRGDGND